MIKIIAGGKKNKEWLAEACAEYEKRLRKPYDLEWQFVEESELDNKVLTLDRNNFVILLDERGQILSSPELAQKIDQNLVNGKNIVFVLGGAFGHFSPEMPQVPSENGGPGAKMPQNAADTTKIDTTCSNNGVLCGRSAPGPQTIHEESVWFPAGEYRVLYRSGLALGNVPEPCASQDTVGIPGGTHATPAPRIMLKIKPVNPPGSFRGLGIICKRNDGTR